MSNEHSNILKIQYKKVQQGLEWIISNINIKFFYFLVYEMLNLMSNFCSIIIMLDYPT